MVLQNFMYVMHSYVLSFVHSHLVRDTLIAYMPFYREMWSIVFLCNNLRMRRAAAQKRATFILDNCHHLLITPTNLGQSRKLKFARTFIGCLLKVIVDGMYVFTTKSIIVSYFFF